VGNCGALFRHSKGTVASRGDRAESRRQGKACRADPVPGRLVIGRRAVVLTAHPDSCLLLYHASPGNRSAPKFRRSPASTSKRVGGNGCWSASPKNWSSTLKAHPRVARVTQIRWIEKRRDAGGQGSHFEIWDIAAWDERLRGVSRKWALTLHLAPKTSRCERRCAPSRSPPPAVDALAIESRHDGTFVDATFGRGGHSRLILERLGPRGR